MIRLHDALQHRLRVAAPSYADARKARETVERALHSGELIATRVKRNGGSIVEFPAQLDVEPLGPVPVEEKTSWFKLTLVDYTSNPIDGVDVRIEAPDRARTQTDASGSARLDDVASSFASAKLANVASVREKLHARWSVPLVDESVDGAFERLEVVEVRGGETLSLDDGEPLFDLVQPRAMHRRECER